MPFGPPRLTLKQRKFAHEYVKNGGKGTDAALAAYDVKKRITAKHLAYQTLHRPLVQEEIERLLVKSGLSIETLADWSHNSIKRNLEQGKPSMAAGISHLEFLYKLHGAMPVTKSMKVTANVGNQDGLKKDLNEIKKQLSELNSRSQKLLTDS